MSHPYLDLPDYCFWSRSVSDAAPGSIDPVTSNRRIGAGDKIATMGSCFAQNLGPRLRAAGLSYFTPEMPAGALSPEAARKQGYGLFSARYGNVYTPKQALQLFERAYGQFVPAEDVWAADGGGYVDAFRPALGPIMTTVDSVRAEVAVHLGNVRRVFEEADWMVLTLGLTEAWRSRRDGATYPLAPGVAAGQFDEQAHEFHNFDIDEVRADLKDLITKATAVNPRLVFLLTVSPVPLAATYEQHHVWVSTTFSKSVLRVAAAWAEQYFPNVLYFPAYEIVTSPAAEGRYYRDDLRSVSNLGVAHVMRLFLKHFAGPADHRGPDRPAEASALSAASGREGIECDEDLIEASIARLGLQRAL